MEIITPLAYDPAAANRTAQRPTAPSDDPVLWGLLLLIFYGSSGININGRQLGHLPVSGFENLA